MVAQGMAKLAELMARIADEGDARIPPLARGCLLVLSQQLQELQLKVSEIERALHAWHRSNETSCRLETIPGIGPITASLITATVGDAIGSFKSARHFAAWLGLVPRQHSSGGKTRLGRITKAGNSEIRRLLVLGATSMVHRAAQWNSAAGAWLRGVLERRPVRLAAVALANKMARIAWAVMTRGETYQAKGRGQVAAAAGA